jgi:hypothetical protein
MKAFVAVLTILILVAVTVTLRAETNDDGRIVQPSHDVSVPAVGREMLSEAADIEAFLTLSNQDCVVVYDAVRDKPGTADFMNNNSHIAFFRSSSVLLNIGSGAATGPVRFHGLATIPVPQPACCRKQTARGIAQALAAGSCFYRDTGVRCFEA